MGTHPGGEERGCAVSAETDTRYTEEPICPHCGKQFEDAYEFFEWGEECVQTECGSCEEKVIISRHETITYSTKKGGAK